MITVQYVTDLRTDIGNEECNKRGCGHRQDYSESHGPWDQCPSWLYCYSADIAERCKSAVCHTAQSWWSRPLWHIPVPVPSFGTITTVWPTLSFRWYQLSYLLPLNTCLQGHSCRMKALYRMTHPVQVTSPELQPMPTTHASHLDAPCALVNVITLSANNALVRSNNESRRTQPLSSQSQTPSKETHTAVTWHSKH